MYACIYPHVDHHPHAHIYTRTPDECSMNYVWFTNTCIPTPSKTWALVEASTQILRKVDIHMVAWFSRNGEGTSTHQSSCTKCVSIPLRSKGCMTPRMGTTLIPSAVKYGVPKHNGGPSAPGYPNHSPHRPASGGFTPTATAAPLPWTTAYVRYPARYVYLSTRSYTWTRTQVYIHALLGLTKVRTSLGLVSGYKPLMYALTHEPFNKTYMHYKAQRERVY
jgi:hypothetical protein